MKTIKYFYIISIVCLLGLLSFCIMNIATPNTKVLASEMDYSALTYHDLQGSFNVATEDVVYKLSCKNPIGKVDEFTEDEYVTIISFRASSGCQVYLMDGKVCCLEDIGSTDSEWTRYSNYYEILQYDETNQFMYLKFKNLDNLNDDETVDADIEDMSIWVRDDTYNQNPQYLYLSEIETPITEITAGDLFFSAEIEAGRGNWSLTNYNLYSTEYTFKLNQKIAHLVTDITISINEGSEDFTMYKSSFEIGEGYAYDNFIEFDCITLGRIDSVTTDVQLKAVVNYGDDKSISVTSTKTNLITLWQQIVANDFADFSVTDANKTIITKFVSAYNSGFYNEIKGSDAYFAKYSNSNNTLQITSLIFRVPLDNLSVAYFSWDSDYWQGYCYTAYVKIASDYTVSATAYKVETTEGGVVEMSLDVEPYASDFVYDNNVANKLLNATEYFAYNGYMYLRIKDYSMVTQYIPQRADYSFSATASDKNSNSVLQANTATVIYDEYNMELLAQIESLTAQLTDLQAQLKESNLLVESQIMQINALNSSLDGLRLDYANAQAELEYVNRQMEVMREEYQKKIDQLIQDNENRKPSDGGDNIEKETPDDGTEERLKVVHLAGIIMGVFLIIAFALLLIPNKKREGKR